jgi:hypothetical protein
MGSFPKAFAISARAALIFLVMPITYRGDDYHNQRMPHAVEFSSQHVSIQRNSFTFPRRTVMEAFGKLKIVPESVGTILATGGPSGSA